MKEKESDLKRLLNYAGNYKILIKFSWLLAAISGFLALAPFIFIWRILKEVLEVSPNYGDAVNISYNGYMAVIFALLSMVVYLGGLLCSHIAAFRVQANIRSKVLHHIVTLPMGFMDTIGSGKLRKIVDECSAATETYLAHQLPDRAVAFATPVGLIVMLVVFDWRLGLLSLLPVVVAFLIMCAMTGSRMAEKMKQYQDSLANMSNEAVEYVRGIPVVKTFGQSVYSFKHFKNAIDSYQKWVISYTKDLRMPMIFYTTAVNAVFAVLIAAAMVFTNEAATKEFLLNIIFYIIITPIITVTLTKIMYSSENKMIVADALKRIDSVLEIKPLAKGDTSQHPTDNSVTLEKVCFKYNTAKENAVDNVSLNIKAGEHIALVGESGGGKTTLASLIARFWDANSGSIKIGGVDVKNIDERELMDMVSFVFQDSKLLKTSIFENVRLGKPTATRKEVLEALHIAQCDDIIEKLPEEIDTVVGTKGIYLSGGEQQRISIARIMLKNSSVLILDEATAFADPDNENKVQMAFSKLSKGKTVIMIAHRLSTVVGCDKIYVLKNGAVAESGSHKELTAKGGIYSNMWNEYQKAVNWKVGALNG